MSTPNPLDMPGLTIGGAGPYSIAVYIYHSVLAHVIGLELKLVNSCSENEFCTIYVNSQPSGPRRPCPIAVYSRHLVLRPGIGLELK
jgi:hypothetical protein